MSMMKGSRAARLPIEQDMAERGATQRSIAAAFGLGVATINRDLNDVPRGTDATTGQPSDQQEYDTDPPDLFHDGTPDMPAGQERADAILAEIDEQVAEQAQTVLDSDLEPDIEPTMISEPDADPDPPRVQVNEGDEWYTPQWLFDALAVKFALDVCAPLDQTHSAVPAERHLTVEDDGLAQPWEGTVWCNPPYSKPEPWARRMIHHGDGLLLTHMPMNAGWCVDMWEVCDAIRLFQAMEFVRPDGSLQRPGYWLQLAAFGPVATQALARLQPLGQAAANKRRVASPMWGRMA
jgi:hypothetical protein